MSTRQERRGSTTNGHSDHKVREVHVVLRRPGCPSAAPPAPSQSRADPAGIWCGIL